MRRFRNLLRKRMSRRGFTLVELLMVITVLALLSGLAISAAVHSVKQSRSKRIEATKMALRVAIMNYRAQEDKWPWDGKSLPSSITTDSDKAQQIIFSGSDNQYVFDKLIQATVKGTPYLDPGSILVDKVSRKSSSTRASRLLRDVLASGISSGLGIVYMDVNNTAKYHYFKVVYNLPTDSVTVLRENE